MGKPARRLLRYTKMTTEASTSMVAARTEKTQPMEEIQGRQKQGGNDQPWSILEKEQLKLT